MTNDNAFVDAFVRDWRTAPLTPKERAMVDYAVTITEDATRVSAATLDGLRGKGFDDTGILQIAAIASWFNYVNRMADALGVGR